VTCAGAASKGAREQEFYDELMGVLKLTR